MIDIIPLFATIVTEYLVVLALIREQPLRTFGWVLLVNLLTHPLALLIFAWFTAALSRGYSVWIVWWLIEICVVLVESVLYWKLLGKRYAAALRISIIANAITAAMSFLF